MAKLYCRLCDELHTYCTGGDTLFVVFVALYLWIGRYRPNTIREAMGQITQVNFWVHKKCCAQQVMWRGCFQKLRDK
jgi:hypothetical protein